MMKLVAIVRTEDHDRIGMEHHNHEKYGARDSNDDVRKKISKMEVF